MLKRRWPASRITANLLKTSQLATPLGSMVAMANDEELYLLEFVTGCGLEREIERFQQHTKSAIIFGYTKIIHSTEKKLASYFDGTLRAFATPLCLIGIPLQQRVWEELRKIPYAKTISYLELASTIGRPTAFRPAAWANGVNQFAIMVHCHIIINAGGNLCRYSAGIPAKSGC